MAKKATSTKKSAASQKSETKVTRITAKDTPSEKTRTSTVKKTATTSKKSAASTAKTVSPKKSKNPLVSIGRYFKGSWDELRQVRWPNRRTAWGLTIAVLLFTLFFLVLIVAFDALFKLLFEQLLS